MSQPCGLASGKSLETKRNHLCIICTVEDCLVYWRLNYLESLYCNSLIFQGFCLMRTKPSTCQRWRYAVVKRLIYSRYLGPVIAALCASGDDEWPWLYPITLYLFSRSDQLVLYDTSPQLLINHKVNIIAFWYRWDCSMSGDVCGG